MPSGYTADLHDGKRVTFQEFAMKCARAFGALIEMRDDPLDASIPDEFLPSNYHLNAVEVARKQLVAVEKWSNVRADKEAKKSFDEEVRSIRESGEDNVESGRAYVNMLKQAGKWVPPTKNHENLKSFMIEQLANSLEFDCLHTPTVPRRLSGKQFKMQSIKRLRRDIAYHTKEHAAEVRRTRDRSKWVRDLHNSLNGANAK